MQKLQCKYHTPSEEKSCKICKDIDYNVCFDNINYLCRYSRTSPINIPLIINGVKTLFMYDTGASDSLLSLQLLEKWAPNHNRIYKSFPGKTLFGVMGKQIPILFDIDLKFTIPEFGMAKLRISITSLKDKSILGRDFHEKFIFQLTNLPNKRIKFKFKKNGNVFSIICKESQYNKSNTVNIIQGSSQITPLKSSKKENTASTIAEQLKILLKLCNATTLYNLCKSSKTYVLFLEKIESKNMQYNMTSILDSFLKLLESKNYKQLMNTEDFISIMKYLENLQIKLKNTESCILYINKLYQKGKNIISFHKFATSLSIQEIIIMNICLANVSNKIKIEKFSQSIKSDINNLFINPINTNESQNINQIISNELEENLNDNPFQHVGKYGIDLELFFNPIKKSFNDIKTEIDIADSEHEKFRDQLANHLNNMEIVSSFDLDCGRLNPAIPPLSLDIDTSNIHKNTKTYRLSFEHEQLMQLIISRLISLNMCRVSPPNMQWRSPVFLIKKGGNSSNRLPRLLIDSRKNNEIINDHSQVSLPECYDVLRQYSQTGCYITSIDMRDCFFTLRASEQLISTGLLNIATNNGNYQLTNLFAGFCLSPSYLIHVMTKYLHICPLTGKHDFIPNIVCFFDDIQIFSLEGESIESHVAKVIKVIERLKFIGFKINISKSKFFLILAKNSIRILGYQFGKNCITIPPAKLKALQDIKEPNSLKKLQAFLGAINFFRYLVPPKYTASLNYLYRQTKTFSWTNASSVHFKTIINCLKNEILKVDKPFKYSINIVLTDASQLGIGGVLLSYNCTSLLKQITIDHFTEKNVYLNNITNKIISAHTNLIICLKQGSERLYYNFGKQSIQMFLIGILQYGSIYPIFEEIVGKENFFQFMNSINTTDSLSDLQINLILFAFSKATNRTICIHTYNNSTESGYNSFYISEFPDIIHIYYLEQKWYFLYLGQNIEEQTLPEFRNALIENEQIKIMFYKALKEKTDNKDVKIMAFYSKSLPQQEYIRHSIVYFELLSIFENLQYFLNYLTSPLIYVLTDSSVCKNLLESNKIQNRSSKLDILAQKIYFNFLSLNVNIIKIPGKINGSDFLSRLLPDHNRFFFPERQDAFISDDFKVTPLSTINNILSSEEKGFGLVKKYEDLFFSITNRSEFIQLQIQELRNTDVNPSTIKLKDGKIYLPQKLYAIFVGLFHGNHDHIRKIGLYNVINKNYFIENKALLKEKIDSLCNNCVLCLNNRLQIHNFKRGSTYKNFIFGPSVGLIADLLELPTNLKFGDKYRATNLLIMEDLFSHFISIFPQKDKTSSSLIHSLTFYFQIFGVPKYFLSDLGPIFDAANTRSFLSDLNIYQFDSSPYLSRVRGRIERKVKTVNQYIRDYMHSLNDKTKIINTCQTIAEIAYSINTQPLPNSYLTPQNLMLMSFKNYTNSFNEIRNNPLNLDFYKYTIIPRTEFDKKAKLLNNEIQSHQEKFRLFKEKQLLKINKHKKDHSFEINDFCLIRNYANKFSAYYLNHVYKCVKINKHTILLRNVLNNSLILRHVSQLKKLNINHLDKYIVPNKLSDDLKLMTSSNINDIFKFDLVKDLPRSSNRNNQIDETDKTDKNEQINFEDIPDIFDSLVELSTIFE